MGDATINNITPANYGISAAQALEVILDCNEFGRNPVEIWVKSSAAATALKMFLVQHITGMRLSTA